MPMGQNGSSRRGTPMQRSDLQAFIRGRVGVVRRNVRDARVGAEFIVGGEIVRDYGLQCCREPGMRTTLWWIISKSQSAEGAVGKTGREGPFVRAGAGCRGLRLMARRERQQPGGGNPWDRPGKLKHTPP